MDPSASMPNYRRILAAGDKATEQKAALAYEREQKRRDLERAREEAMRHKERERRQLVVDKAQGALEG